MTVLVLCFIITQDLLPCFKPESTMRVALTYIAQFIVLKLNVHKTEDKKI